MAIQKPTLSLLRQLMVAVGGEADAVTRSLTQAWTRSWDDLAVAWKSAMDDVVARAAATGEWPSAWQLGRMERLGRAVGESETALAQLSKRAGVTITDGAGQVVKVDADYEPRLVSSQLPAAEMAAAATVYTARVTPTALDFIVARSQSQIASTLIPLSADATEAMRRSLIQGIAVGSNPNVAARQMVDRVEGAFNGGLSRAINIARTEMLDAYRSASRYSHAANADVVTGWVWLSTLDGRTCPACWSMHGRVFPVEQPGPLDHQQGRCARAPKTKSWADLGFNVKEPADEIPDARAVFGRLSPERQHAIMGPGRLGLLNSGKVGWNDLASLRASVGWRQSYVPRAVTDLQRLANGRRVADVPLAPSKLPGPLARQIPAPAVPSPDVATPGARVRAAALTVRPVLEAARTVAAVNRVFTAEAQRITGRRITSAMDGSAATAREHAEGILRGLERYPEANLSHVGMMSPGIPSPSYAETTWDTIRFSRAYSSAAGRQGYLDALASDTAGWGRPAIVDGKNATTAFHPRNTGNAIAIGVHEFGHILDIATTAERVRPRVAALIKQLVKDYGPVGPEDRAAGRTASKIIISRSISGYATRNGQELVAEAFAEVMMNGRAASLLARNIVDLLEAEYRRDRLKLGIRLLTPSASMPDLTKLTVPVLRKMAKDLGIKGLSKARKADIIAAINKVTPDGGGVAKPVLKSTAAKVADGDFKGLKRVGPQGGSNPGGVFEADDGSRWYIKRSKSEDHANEQALAATFYRELGLETPQIIVGRGVAELGPGFQTATRIVDDATPGGNGVAFLAKVREGFVADAWLADWDVGQSGNLLKLAGGKPIRMDIGGSLRYRAQGGPKGSQFGDSVGEWLTMRDPRNVSGHLFQGITLPQLKESVARLVAISDDRIKALVRQHHLGPELARTLIARRADIVRRLADDIAAAEPKVFVAGADHLVSVNSSSTLANEVVRAAQADFAAPGAVADPMLSAVARLQGFDAVPAVISRAEMTKLLRDPEHTLIYRGVDSGGRGRVSAGRKTAAQMQEEMRTGNAYFGLGVYGNGYYFSTVRTTSVAYSDHSAGSVVRATLRKGAKTVDSDVIYREWQAYKRGLAGNRGQVYGDVGRYAAARGYDVIIKDQGWGSATGEKYYIVLNRSALIVEKAVTPRKAVAR